MAPLVRDANRLTMLGLIVCGWLLQQTNAASACRGGGHGIPVATIEPALNPKPSEISFIGEVIRLSHNTVHLRVVRPIQGYVAAFEDVFVGCNLRWGKVGETIPIIGFRHPDDPKLFMGLGGGASLGADGRERMGRD